MWLNLTPCSHFHKANILTLVILKCFGLFFSVKFRGVFQVVCSKMCFMCEV